MSLSNSGIYQIRNIINNKCYIGSSNDLKIRKRLHFWDLERGKHSNSHLQHAYNKYGKNNFAFEVLYLCRPEILLQQEQMFLDAFLPNLYNIAVRAESPMKGRKASEETKKKISKFLLGNQRRLGIPHTEDAKKSISKSLMGNDWCVGHVHTDEHNDKISLWQKGRPKSEAYKQKMSKVADRRKRDKFGHFIKD